MRKMRKLALGMALTVTLGAAPALAYDNNCWGQATAAFAQSGAMGEHASQQAEPRDGLANLANALYMDGMIDAPTVQALGAYLVSIDPNLTVESCMD